MASPLRRYAAFTDDPGAGNPAGVWIGDALPDDAEMQRIAAALGDSETAFVAPAQGSHRTVRYFSPDVEVPFCGHATVATGVALGEADGPGTYRLATAAGEVPVDVRQRGGRWEASLTSVATRHEPASDALVADALAALGWEVDDLDPSIPPARAYAGAWHLVLAAASAERLAALDYDFDALRSLMHRDGLTTLQLVWREAEGVFLSRNPFPVGGVIEDPATGAAAAALGGYLRNAGLRLAPFDLDIRQGEAMGRPSRIAVSVPASGGVVVTGIAVPIPMRIVVLGNSGSGKTTFARELVDAAGLVHLDLDAVAWAEPGVRRPLAESAAEIEAFAQSHDAWVIGGSYADLAEAALPFCTELRFLNPGVEACVANCQRRPWEPEKYASPEEQDERLAFLLDWVRKYETRDDEYGLKAHRSVFDAFAGSKFEIPAGRDRQR